MMWWYGPGMGGWGFALMTISMILFWALIILGTIALVKYVRTGTEGTPQARQRQTPEELLAERFARGEIDEQEYGQRLNTLRGKSSSLLER